MTRVSGRRAPLKQVEGWVLDVATFCEAIKPALFKIAEFVLYFVGLTTVVGFVLHR